MVDATLVPAGHGMSYKLGPMSEVLAITLYVNTGCQKVFVLWRKVMVNCNFKRDG